MTVSHSSHVFLSYARADGSFVSQLQSDLQAQGIAVWIDHKDIQPGTPDWEDSLRKAIRHASAVVLVASPSARSSRNVKNELRIAEMYKCPVYPLWAMGNEWMDAVLTGWGGTQYIDAREERYQGALHEMVMILEKLNSPADAADVRSGPSFLQSEPPLTLDQLFQRRKGRQLTTQAYREIGGVKGALANHAEATYASLPSDEHRRLARALFLRLVDPGTTEQDMTRRRAAFSELEMPDPQETATLREVVRIFTAARLLVTNTVAGVSTVEVSHEALMREWKLLADWIHEAREDIQLRKAISEDAMEWKRRGCPLDRLYRGSQLSEALAWRERNSPNIDEDAFLSASMSERERQKTAEQERQRQEEEKQKKLTRRTVLAAGVGLAGIAAVAAVSGYFLSRKPQEVPVVINPPKRLPYSYQGHSDAVLSVAWSPDGKRLASASWDKTVQVWEASSGTLLLTYTGHLDVVWSVAWSLDGKQLASASWDKTVQVWEASGGTHLLTYTGHSDAVHSVAWSPDGKRLASASWDKTVQVWEASNGTHLLTYKGHSSAVDSVAWSPDGYHIASAGQDGAVQVWLML